MNVGKIRRVTDAFLERDRRYSVEGKKYHGRRSRGRPGIRVQNGSIPRDMQQPSQPNKQGENEDGSGVRPPSRPALADQGGGIGVELTLRIHAVGKSPARCGDNEAAIRRSGAMMDELSLTAAIIQRPERAS
jgi:hypothetical protein